MTAAEFQPSFIPSVDPRTGKHIEDVAPVTSDAEVADLAVLATSAAPELEARGRSYRASLLRAIAYELESRRADIISLGMRETALPEARLNGELTRTAYQARFFADVLDEGSYLEATIDHAGDTPMGPGPDLRRMLVPLGPVAVFGASNFPLAFSVPGGDTISALAAGSSVIIKAHSSHPALSRLTFRALDKAARSVGAPKGTLGLVFGTEAGAKLVAHPGIRAVGFTGSLSGGRALMEIIAQRETPIPFYGELSSLNPVVVTEFAAARRTAEIAAGIVGSVTGSGGQLCTKPGLVFIPRGASGDAVAEHLAELISAQPAATLLNERISSSYDALGDDFASRLGVSVLGKGEEPADGFSVTPRLLEIDAEELSSNSVDECFGPTAVIARYDEVDELEAAFGTLPASLTATIFGETDDDLGRLDRLVRAQAGRILYDQYPTGVLVSWAQHHGGPWPSTNTLHTSVGATAIRRFLRPIVWQNAPQAVLPSELLDEEPSGITRRIDGQLIVPKREK